MSSRNLADACSILRAAIPQIVLEYERAHPDFILMPIQVLRTVEEQQKLYASGRTEPGPWLTNCDGVKKLSNHQAQEKHGEGGVSHAVDLGAFKQGAYKTDASYYVDLKDLAAAHGLKSGWDFDKPDPDHLECVPPAVQSDAQRTAAA